VIRPPWFGRTEVLGLAPRLTVFDRMRAREHPRSAYLAVIDRALTQIAELLD
jgi:hypothetical protein